MATLTSTGASVNLTSTTNWSPSQIPVAGDDLVIGAATLTLDADMTLNTVTLNNASSRVAFTGTTRIVQATNGWIVPTAIPATLITTVISAGISLTLRGKWSFSNTGLVSLLIGDVSGGSLSLATVGDDPTAILIENPSSGADAITRVATISSGSLATTGRFNVSRGTYGNIVAMTGGLWVHNSTGQNVIGGFAFSSGLVTLSGSSSIIFSGNVTYTGGQQAAFSIANNWSGTVSLLGSFSTAQVAAFPLVVFGTGCTGSFTLVGSPSLPANTVAATVRSGTLLWQNQSATLPANSELRFDITGGTVSFTGLILSNYGRLAVIRSSGTFITDANTEIKNYSPTGQAIAINSDQFNSRIIQLGIGAPTLPAVEEVAAGEVYGYTGFEQTGTGLIMDPAIIAAASTAAMTSVLTTYDIATTDDILAVLQPNPASVATRSIEDDKPLTFSWPNSTDTITGEVSIDNGAYVAVEGAIAYLREEDGKFYFTLAYDAADRPAEEGTARYKFSSSNYTMYATLRITVTDPSTVGDWAVKRTFEYNGETVQGVRLLLVGISGKANTSGTDGIAQVNTNNGTFVLRTVVPVGFESIPDETIVINDADNNFLVELTPMAIPTVADGLCVLQLHLRSQGTTEVIPLIGVNVTAKLVGGPKVIGSVLHLDIVDTATTDVNGYAPLVLLQNTIYDLSITLTNSIHIKKIRITIPEASSAIISEVI